MATINRELDRLGRNIIEDAKSYARPNKKTGTLERSLSYKTSVTSDDDFTLILEEVYYGKFLNDKTNFMDRAIDKNIDRGIRDIVNVQIKELLTF